MRLFVAILFFLSSAVSWAAGITSKTADFIIYKNSLGSSTIKIPDWELVIDGDSFAGKKNLPVPKSNTSFNTTLPLPRGKLMTNLAKFAKFNPYLFIAQGLIDLYFDEATREFMTSSNPSGIGSDGGEFAVLVQKLYPGEVLNAVYSRNMGIDEVFVTLGSRSIRLYIDSDSWGNKYVWSSEGRYTPYNDHVFTSLRGVNISELPYENGVYYIYRRDQNQLIPATETDIAQNLNKNVTSDKLPLVRDLIKSQNWTLETDTTPTVTGPSEVVISTQERTIQNPDGTTTTQKVVEKNVYTYNGNTIIENNVTQVFYGDQLVENNVTNVNTETSTEPVDYTFQPPTGEYPTDLEVPEKRDLVAEVLNPVASQLTDFGSKVGLRGSGQCSFDIPFSLGHASGSGRLDFCQYQSTFSSIGSMLVTFAYLMAGLIVLGMRH